MTKLDAICELIKEAQADKTTNASAKRAVAACHAVGLNRLETIEILYLLDICDELGRPYGTKIKRVW